MSTLCSKRVFSADRFDMDGHQCSRKGVVEADGKWYCKLHSPEGEEEAQRKRDEKYASWKRGQDRTAAIAAATDGVLRAAREWAEAAERDGATADALSRAVARLKEAEAMPDA
jgi:hypothetical protein